MKKIILAMVFLSMGAIVQNVQAQSKFEWGVRAGLNLSSVTGFDEMKFRQGFAAGVFGEYTVNDFLGIQAELLYAQEGDKSEHRIYRSCPESDILAYTGTFKNNRDYIQLPVFAKVYLFEGLSIDAGVRLGYIVGQKSRMEFKSEGNLVECVYDRDDHPFGDRWKPGTRSENIIVRPGVEFPDFDYGDSHSYNDFDLSVLLGASYKFRFGLDVFARYNLGLTDAYTSRIIFGTETFRSNKSRSVFVGVGYRF